MKAFLGKRAVASAISLVGLIVLVSGVFVFGEMRRGLVQARMDSLRTQGTLIANVLAKHGAQLEKPRALPPL